MRFGNDELKKEVESINSSILEKLEEKRIALLIQMANEQCESDDISELTEAYELFTSLGKAEEADACSAKIEKLYDNRYNELYLAAQETEQEIKNRQYQNSSATTETVPHKPSTPSVRLVAFVMATIMNMAMGMNQKPASQKPTNGT